MVGIPNRRVAIVLMKYEPRDKQVPLFCEAPRNMGAHIVSRPAEDNCPVPAAGCDCGPPPSESQPLREHAAGRGYELAARCLMRGQGYPKPLNPVRIEFPFCVSERLGADVERIGTSRSPGP